MKAGARNQLRARVVSVKKGDIMAQVHFTIVSGNAMSSVLTVDSLDELDLKPGDEVTLLVKAIHVLPVKD